ncbi:PepSY domain-containing protein [Lentilitoribacter sp. EG35]|uniref:PepSY domain-containing protein n=1 Tax=Lentilitoribacter sp. EG35 TaxID=3234192 RepID=UPI00345FFD6C
MRFIHSLSGIVAAIFISVIAMMGAYLSVGPVIDQFSVASTTDLSVADIAGIANKKIHGVERIERKASGEILVHAFTQDGAITSILDPRTNELMTQATHSKFTGFVTELHRSLFLGDLGRGLTGLSAFLLILITYSGLVMLAKRMGGWSKIFGAARGSKSQRQHIDIARLTMVGFSISALTGLYMSLATFGIIAEPSDVVLPFPEDVAIGETMPVAEMKSLAAVPISDLRELTFPYPDDPTDVFTLNSDQGEGFIDQVTGEIIAFQPSSLTSKIYETVYLLHTGRGGVVAAILSFILGASALAIPFLSLTGIVIWWRRRKHTPRTQPNAHLPIADTILLVGSEGSTTWGFASTLHKALAAQGKKVHTSAMNELMQEHLEAKNIFILTSTYGDGIAPASANKFLKKLENMEIAHCGKFAILGFGDKQFSNFCGFAETVEKQLRHKNAEFFHPLAKINQQSPQTFRDWGQQIGQIVNCDLVLEHVPARPKTNKIALQKVVVRSQELDEQTAILRFNLLQNHFGFDKRMSKFEAGDLIGIIPPKSDVPRYYSIASSSYDGFIEICVKRHKLGLCSNYLLNLNEGDKIDYFIKENNSFKPVASDTPLVMIGAGTGIAPLAGFARGNVKNRPAYLFWGGRNPNTDFLYKDTLVDLTKHQKLSDTYLAFSRITDRQYVQDKLKSEAELLKELISEGAQILVCGGPEMALGVRTTIDGIISQIGESATSLQQQKRYLEDVY